MALLVKAGGSGGKPYIGDNPLTIGADGYSFDPKTLLKDGLTIVNGVEGEDLTATEADMALAITELQRIVARKVSDHKGVGEYVWRKLTAQNGDFIDFVVNSDETAYPDKAEQDGYWYERVVEGVSGIDYGEITITAHGSITIQHNLKKVPSKAYLLPKSSYNANSVSAGHTFANIDGRALYVVSSGSIYQYFFKGNYPNTMTEETVTFGGWNNKFYKDTYYWFVVE